MSSLATSTIAIAGLGLMGGSLGLALRGHVHRVIGVARRTTTLEQALALGAIDLGVNDLRGAAAADIIVLATPVSVILAQINELGRLAAQGELRPNVIVTDMGSTKQQICAALDALPAIVQPIGGHPMCGKETSGLDVAEAALYHSAPYVLCPLSRTTPATVARLTELAQAIGAAPLVLDASRHDRLTAAISHVPYLAALATFAAAADVAQEDPLAWQLAASGFRSTTRLAGSDDQMMSDILLSNRDAVLTQVQRLQAQLTRLADTITRDDETALRSLAAAARSQRAEFVR
ncbi:MAG: prephenate dehydrogenase/arogenate dehydrogenase family protein [Anaerolineae bacterium]